MKETFETGGKEYFKYPNIQKEEGVFERVAQEFGIEMSVSMFLAQSGELVEMDGVESTQKWHTLSKGS